MPTNNMTTDKLLRNESLEPANYKNDDVYQLPASSRTYSHQYNAIYSTRVRKLKSRVLKMAHQKWKSETINDEKVGYVNKILDIKNQTPCYIVGTVFIDMKYKPNILKDVSENLYGAPEVEDLSNVSKVDQIRMGSYCDPKHDQVMLEDESGRILVDGELLDNIVLVTGAIVGFLGMEIESGIFTIVDIVYPEPADQIQRPMNEIPGTNNKILFLSGFILSDQTDFGPVEILKEYIMGELTSNSEDFHFLKSITRIIIAGNSIRSSDSATKEVLEKNKYRESNKSNYDAEALKQLDNLISDLLTSIPVTIMPGDSDPSEISFPKQPLHKSFFPKSSAYQNFKRVTNPEWFDIDNLRILGTSGENINDMFKYVIPNIAVNLDSEHGEGGIESPIRKEVVEESRLKLIEATLHWQNIIPTAPDTLWCYPYEENDPFTLDETPHVYFVGNQPRFETSKMELYRKDGEIATVRVIAIPEFSETGEVVLLDTDTLECTSLKISV